MNDRFKFRAYNKELRKMYEVDSICPYEDNHTKGGEVFLKEIQYNSFYFPEEVEVMQCTGLKDKNGKLIYEGDIVRFKDNITINGSKTHISVVEHNEAFNAFMYHAKCMGLYTVNKAQNEKFDVEVIGNIYENKELLESEG